MDNNINRFYEALIIEFGGISKAAEALNVKYQCIHNWKKRGVPMKRVKEIEQLTNLRVHRGMLDQ